MSSMTEDCETGIYGAKPWTNQEVAPKPHNEKSPNPDNEKTKVGTHTKITRIGITKGSERKIIKMKTNQNGNENLLKRHTQPLSSLCSYCSVMCDSAVSY